MRFLLTFTLILVYETLFPQDSCFLKPTFSIDDYAHDQMVSFSKKLDDYINTFIGCRAPEFQVTTVEGKKISFAQLKGKVVVLNFWFTHCKPCVAEFPSLNRLAEEYGPKGVVFISFALDSAMVLDTFLINHPLKYDVVSASNNFARLFKIGAYPTNIILNKDYKVAKIFHGGNVVPEDALKNYELFKPFIEAELSRRH
jgi:thiol-disulfide isomerase/thioredoxin